MAYDLSKLINLKTLPDGWQCQCPQCANEGRDTKGKNHLRIYKSGAFNCCVDNSKEHNRAVRAFLLGDSPEEDFEFIDPQPKLTVEAIYPEDTLKSLIPDYSYWVGRGMKEDVLKKLECGVAPKEERGKLNGRTVFPLRNLDGKIAGFSGRLITDNSFAPRWKHLAKVGLLVYPWNMTGKDIEKTKKVILVESIGDLLALLSHDINPVLCIFGLNLGDRIVGSLVAADVQTVYVSLNRDVDPRKGQAAADKIAKRLEPFVREVKVRLPKITKDWGESILTPEGRADMDEFRKEIGE